MYVVSIPGLCRKRRNPMSGGTSRAAIWPLFWLHLLQSGSRIQWSQLADICSLLVRKEEAKDVLHLFPDAFFAIFHMLVVVVLFYLTTLFQYLRLYSVDFYSILIRLPSSSEAGEMRVRSGRWILPTSTYRARRVLLHAVTLRHGTDGFTSPPKEVVLRILSPLKSIVLGRVSTREPWVQWQAR
jgi:hypothetical protein